METGVIIVQEQALKLQETPVMPLINCLVQNDRTELLIIESELTIAKAMNSVSLRNLNSIIGKRNIIKAITALLMRLSENFNMKGKFNNDQSAIIALDLFEVFGYETLEDVLLMFKYVRQGKIGDGKDFKLDSSTVFHKWVPEYLELKAECRENDHKKKKGELNGMANFKWKKDDPKKIKTSDKVETFREGLGTRIAKAFAVEDVGVKNEVFRDRESMMKTMRASLPNQSVASLEAYIKQWEHEPKNDSEVLAMVKRELTARQSK